MALTPDPIAASTTSRRTPPSAAADLTFSWGDRVLPEAPTFRASEHTARAAAAQVGFGVDPLGLLHLSSRRALWIAAHSHRAGSLPLVDGIDETTGIKISMASHGLSVLTLRRSRRAGSWSVAEAAGASHNRRVHGTTPCKMTGPVAGDRRLRTTEDASGRLVSGTFGHTVGTLTPWGAALSAEGDFASYFDARSETDPALRASFDRYGLGATGRGWSAVDPRFDLASEPAEAFRHGWVVLLDPRRPSSRPRKLTMLGRLAHTGIRARLADDGRAVIHLRDDGRSRDHLGHNYVYVSRGIVDHGIGPLAGRHNRRLLTTGTLHLVLPWRRTDDPSGWMPLTTESTSHVEGLSVAGVLMDTRLAARRLLASL